MKTMKKPHTKPQMQSEISPPFPKQHQKAPGLESRLKPAPRYLAQNYRAAGKLEGKVALITGGDSGIGRAVAVLYAREGADVAIVYLPQEASDALTTCHVITELGRRCLMLEGDLTDPAFCAKAVDRTVRGLGALDILVSNAAHQARKKSLQEVSDEEFDRTFKTNIYAYFHLARAAIPRMKPGSSIIATSSVTGLLGEKELPDYSATKGAINAFTKTLAQQVQGQGIRVNAVAPARCCFSLPTRTLPTLPEPCSRSWEARPPAARGGWASQVSPHASQCHRQRTRGRLPLDAWEPREPASFGARSLDPR